MVDAVCEHDVLWERELEDRYNSALMGVENKAFSRCQELQSLFDTKFLQADMAIQRRLEELAQAVLKKVEVDKKSQSDVIERMQSKVTILPEVMADISRLKQSVSVLTVAVGEARSMVKEVAVDVMQRVDAMVESQERYKAESLDLTQHIQALGQGYERHEVEVVDVVQVVRALARSQERQEAEVFDVIQHLQAVSQGLQRQEAELDDLRLAALSPRGKLKPTKDCDEGEHVDADGAQDVFAVEKIEDLVAQAFDREADAQTVEEAPVPQPLELGEKTLASGEDLERKRSSITNFCEAIEAQRKKTLASADELAMLAEGTPWLEGAAHHERLRSRQDASKSDGRQDRFVPDGRPSTRGRSSSSANSPRRSSLRAAFASKPRGVAASAGTCREMTPKHNGRDMSRARSSSVSGRVISTVAVDQEGNTPASRFGRRTSGTRERLLSGDQLNGRARSSSAASSSRPLNCSSPWRIRAQES